MSNSIIPEPEWGRPSPNINDDDIYDDDDYEEEEYEDDPDMPWEDDDED
jgi:hypothetical protein